MKIRKLLSLALSATMVCSLMPATAFAGQDITATAKIVGSETVSESSSTQYLTSDIPELQIKVTDVSYSGSDASFDNTNLHVATDTSAEKDAMDVAEGVLQALEGLLDDADKAIGDFEEAESNIQSYDGDFSADITNSSDYTTSDVTDYDSMASGDQTLIDGYLSDLNGAMSDYETAITDYSDYDDLESAVNAADAEYSDAEDAYNEAVAASGNSITSAMKSAPQMDVDLELDEAEWYGTPSIYVDSDERYPAIIDDIDIDDEDMSFTIYGKLYEDDVIVVEMQVSYKLDSDDYATVSIDSDMVEADDIVFLSCTDQSFSASVDDIVYVAEDESVTLEDIELESDISGTFLDGDLLVLELSSGFEFDDWDSAASSGVSLIDFDEEYAYFEIEGDQDDIDIVGLVIYADSASEGDVCDMEITLYDATSGSSKGSDEDKQYSADKIASDEIEVAEVCDYTVVISVDEDDDVPVMYSGTDADDFGLDSDYDHESLEITIEESFPGAWSYRDTWSLILPEGVYVTEIDFDEEDIDWADGENSESNFIDAYQEGEWESFEFSKRVFTERTSDDDKISMTFTLTLVAVPGFEGEVELSFEGDSVTDSEVVIAEFVSPFTVEASQNDMIIDYRYTPIETAITITEAEAELLTDDMTFYFQMEESYITFEDKGDVTVSDCGMEIDFEIDDATIEVEIEEESDDDAAVITIDGLELYMSRDLAAGAYGLEMYTSASVAFMAQEIFAPEADSEDEAEDDELVWFIGDVINGTDEDDFEAGDDGYVVEVCENFVNIVTAGSDVGDAFTTTVIVPVGEYYIYAGGTQIALDVPAYINSSGYTMLPVRAVANAIGVSESCVLWDSATRQVTIIYGTKTVAMIIGQSYMTVNGTAIPMSSAPEITDSRTFLPLRDLATALGVTEINWDSSTRTAQLN